MSGYAVKSTASSKLRARLGHPVIDGDAHIIECPFVLPDVLKMVGGSDLVKRFDKALATALHWAQAETNLPLIASLEYLDSSGS